MAVAAIPLIISAVAAAGAAVEEKQASDRQAKAVTQAANYNAKVDIANAQQLQMNADANIQKQRQEDASYQSSQRVALAASGVLSGTGSPMELQATTAGRQEQDIQTYYASVQEKESQLYGSAQEGVYEGAEEADIYHLQGAGDIFNGIGSVANYGSKAYQAGQGT